jgi:hypothetical protein
MIIIGNVEALRWLGFNILLAGQLAVVDLLVLGGWIATLTKLHRIADTIRRRHRYLICEEDYAAAPLVVQGKMQEIFKAGRSLATSRAHCEGMFGDIDTDGVLYSAAEQVVQAAEINTSLRKLKTNASPSHEDAIRRARVALRNIGRNLDEVNADLGIAAKNAKNLSKKLAEAERARIAAQKEELVAERRRAEQAEARMKVEQSTAQAETKMRVDATDIADRVAAVSAGYDEASGLSDEILGGSDAAAPPPSFARTAWRVAGTVSGWISRTVSK